MREVNESTPIRALSRSETVDNGAQTTEAILLNAWATNPPT
jgi:hypothetical protein